MLVLEFVSEGQTGTFVKKHIGQKVLEAFQTELQHEAICLII